MGVLCLTLFGYALLSVISFFADILIDGEERADCFTFTFLPVLWSFVFCDFLMVPWVGMQCVIVIFPYLT